MKKILLSLLLVVSVISITGCKKENSIVGKWEIKIGKNSYVYTFKEDGTCEYNVTGTIMKCTYKTNKDKLSIKYDGDTVSFDTTYSIKGNKLNVKDSFGSDTIYTRK